MYRNHFSHTGIVLWAHTFSLVVSFDTKFVLSNNLQQVKLGWCIKTSLKTVYPQIVRILLYEIQGKLQIARLQVLPRWLSKLHSHRPGLRGWRATEGWNIQSEGIGLISLQILHFPLLYTAYLLVQLTSQVSLFEDEVCSNFSLLHTLLSLVHFKEYAAMNPTLQTFPCLTPSTLS